MPRPKVICLTNGVYQENCYLLADPDARAAVLIDPGEEADLFLHRVGTERLTLQAIWLTHAHLDHILGVKASKPASPSTCTRPIGCCTTV